MSTPKIYRGDSLPVAKVVQIMPILVVAGQSYSIICSNKSVTYVARTGDGPANVSAGLATAIAASPAPEFAEFTATVSTNPLNAGALILVAATAGVPFDVTVASSGCVTVSESVPGGGAKNEVHNVQLLGNYTGGNFTVTYTIAGNTQTSGNIAYNARLLGLGVRLLGAAGDDFTEQGVGKVGVVMAPVRR